MSVIKVGDKVNAGNNAGTVEKIAGEKALIRFQGYKRWHELRELVLSSEYVPQEKKITRRQGRGRR